MLSVLGAPQPRGGSTRSCANFPLLSNGCGILPIIIDGTPDAERCGVDASQECFPQFLLEQLRAREQGDSNALEPVGADVRDAFGKLDRTRRNIAFLKVVAGLIGAEFDDLYGRDQRQRTRWFRRILLGALGVMVTFAIIAASALISAFTAEIRADQALVAQSNFLADAAIEKRDAGNSGLALHLARASLPKTLTNPDRPFTDRAHQTLRSALQHLREERVFVHELPLVEALFDSETSVLTLDSAGVLRRWSLTDGTKTASADLGKGPHALDLLQENSPALLVAEAGGHISLRHPKDLKLIRQWKTNDTNVRGIAATKDGRSFLTLESDGMVRLWREDSESPIAAYPNASQTFSLLAVSPDGRLAAFARQNGRQVTSATTVVIVDIEKTEEVAGIDVGSMIASMTFSPDSSQLAVGAGFRGHVIDLKTLQKVLETRQHQAPFVTSVAFHPTHSRLLTGGADGEVQITDVRTGESLGTMSGHTKSVRGIHFPQHGNVAITYEGGGTINIWRSTWLRLFPDNAVLRGHDGRLHSLRLSPDGDKIVTAGADGTARVWRLGLRGFEQLAPAIPSSDFIYAAAADLSTVAVRTKNGDVVLGKITGLGEAQVVRTGFNDNVNADTSDDDTDILNSLQVGFSPSGKLVAIGDRAAGLAVYRTVDLKEISRAPDWRPGRLMSVSDTLVATVRERQVRSGSKSG